jgi:hypothetical protein
LELPCVKPASILDRDSEYSFITTTIPAFLSTRHRLAECALVAIVHSLDFRVCAVRASLKVSGNRLTAGLSTGLAAGVAGAALLGSIGAALAECKPSHVKAPYFIRTMGPCGFNSETLSFRGKPAQQAMCLMRGMDATRNLAPTLEGLPPGLAKRVGETTDLPSRELLSDYLSKLNLEWDFAMYLWQPVARARDNDPDAPMAKYFVIHDTSGPNYGHRDFPGDINTNPKINNLKSFVCYDEWGKAHVVIDRMGDILVNHDFSIPWRETKFEQAAEFGGTLKGLFIHNEMIQPRRAGPHGGDSQSPDPAFTPAQYDRLALVYTVVSVRAGRWLIPAFHAALDADIRNGHDDPLNFKVESFADSIDRLMDKLQGSGQFQASNATTETDAQPDSPAAANGGFWVDALWGTPHKAAVVASPATSPAASSDDPPKLNLPSSADSSTEPVTNAGGSSAASGAASNAIIVPGPLMAVKPPAPHEAAQREKVAERSSEPPHREKSADTCTTHRVRGHLHRVCEPDRAAGHEHGKHAARTAERNSSQRGSGARHRGADSHQHSAGASSRHRRS